MTSPDAPQRFQVVVHRDQQHLAQGAAWRVAESISAARRSQGPTRFSLGLAGGSTPAETYRRLREMDVDWDLVDAWLSDERWVPPDHQDSNGAMVARLLADHVPVRFLRPRWAGWLIASDSAAHYEADLRSIHADGRPDLVMLGMGDDGHTASLFPGTSAVETTGPRWYVANHVPRLDADRLTATFRFLHSAHHLMILVAGQAKASALRQVLEPVAGEDVLPARRAMGVGADVTWMVDEAAAGELQRTALIRAD